MKSINRSAPVLGHSKIILLALVLLPSKMFACAACYGANIDSPMADGMNWAILTLGTIITVVLGSFLTFLIYAIRKSEAVEAARISASKSPGRPDSDSKF